MLSSSTCRAPIPGAVELAARLTQRAAVRITALGTPVGFLRSIDAAESEDAVREAAPAGVQPFEHVAEVAEEPLTR